MRARVQFFNESIWRPALENPDKEEAVGAKRCLWGKCLDAEAIGSRRDGVSI